LFSLDQKQMEKVVSGFQIPIKPEVLTNIQQLMSITEPDIEEVAALVSNDIGLSSAILKIINSPFYGMNRRISEIKQAVMMLGLTTINSLVTAIALRGAFEGEAAISLERFWDDATDVANAMTFLGQKVKSEIPVDMLYTLGLFHDCGIALLALKYPDYKDILIEANNSQTNSVALEEQHYQTNHAVLGFYVASSWNLPKELCQMILIHHDNQAIVAASDKQQQLALAVLKAAENLTETAKRYQQSSDWPQVKKEILSILGISEEDYSDLEDDFSELFDA